MIESEKKIVQLIAHTVRALAVDAIERQQSGHPGLPLGAAELGACLYARHLRHDPADPAWLGRDRCILSAGHGSMLQYTLLHLCGYDLTIEDLKNFRQLYSRTPGHPEFGVTAGVETTTGPLGQGVASATGMAMAQKFLAARFSAEWFDARIWVLAGDGCMMEGITAEAGSLAGALGLNNLIILYDANDVCLDGPVREVMTEDVAARYRAYGFEVITIDGHDLDQIDDAFGRARRQVERPVLIIARTVIGRHAPGVEGASVCHGGALGATEMARLKNEIGWPESPLFYVPAEVHDYFQRRGQEWADAAENWRSRLAQVLATDEEMAKRWQMHRDRQLPDSLSDEIWALKIKPDQPTRRYNEKIVELLGDRLPFLVTGSADVSSCDFTWLQKSGIVSRDDWHHQQIKFGVREFCMAACACGMQLHGMVQPVIGTFLVFSDYMRNAIRLSALMKQRVIYVFSHDSILLAQDGPTHQPVEHLMALRLIPHLTVIRPGDENEARAAWIAALKHQGGPVALCFTRQPVRSTCSEWTASRARAGVAAGAYCLYGDLELPVAVELFASGSEIHPAFEAAKKLETKGHAVRVISVPSWEWLAAQSADFQKRIYKSPARLKVSVEAGRGTGWERFVGLDGLIISQEDFGASAPEEVMADHFGFTAEKVYQRILDRLRSMQQEV